MEGETVSSQSRNSFDSITILVVDDDITCLAIVAALLKKFKYQVVTVKHPSDALCTLRIKGGAFDLVVSDIHMPDMDGFELQQAIAQEFHLPVVLMSADKKEGVVSKGLESGAALFIPKPVSPDDLRNLWKFAAPMKKKSQVLIEETASKSNKGCDSKKDTKTKPPSDDKRVKNSKLTSTKKHKVIWNNALHNRFLEAIRSIGLGRSVPKKILEVMDVPGLTRENVASHLQKYRIFLKRVSEASCKIYSADDRGLSRGSRLSFSASAGTSPASVLMLNQNPGNSPGGLIKAQSRFGQSQLVSSLLKQDFTNANLIGQNDRPRLRLAQEHNYDTSPLFQGHLSSVLSANLDASSVLGSTWKIGPELYPGKNTGEIPNNVMLSIPSENVEHQTNFVGYKISNVNHLADTGTFGGDNINDLEQFVSNFVASSSSSSSSSCVPDHRNDGGQLSDVVADYVLPSSDHHQPFHGNAMQNAVEGSALSSFYHPLPEFDIIMDNIQQPLVEGGLNNTFADQLNIQNQAQINGGENISSSSFHGGTNNFDNHVSCYDQAPNQRDDDDDDDFMAWLLAFGDDQGLAGM